MSEINYFNFFTMHDDVVADARWVLMWHVTLAVRDYPKFRFG
jgi:hypothetical protein